jgi:hypothetical protein
MKSVTIPAYCKPPVGTLTPSQYATCLKAGWDEPTTTAGNAGHLAGSGAGIAVLLAIAVVVVWFFFKKKRPAA